MADRNLNPCAPTWTPGPSQAPQQLHAAKSASPATLFNIAAPSFVPQPFHTFLSGPSSRFSWTPPNPYIPGGHSGSAQCCLFQPYHHYPAPSSYGPGTQWFDAAPSATGFIYPADPFAHQFQQVAEVAGEYYPGSSWGRAQVNGQGQHQGGRSKKKNKRDSGRVGISRSYSAESGALEDGDTEGVRKMTKAEKKRAEKAAEKARTAGESSSQMTGEVPRERQDSKMEQDGGEKDL
ncbi:hypothetical protein EK21DRAFT_109781 [Setomelanomma holmii]|uniref:Uncharacterized protein n=1 Tax=Setomelanomma holmii TaxID=210430 RepID=A0A9P4LMI3_9PLEO|nr:hypothetical protein EK21DRAFT_109781 [Setomelanomma holmii]